MKLVSDKDRVVVCSVCLVPVMAGTEAKGGRIVWCTGGCGHIWEVPSEATHDVWRAAWQYYRERAN